MIATLSKNLVRSNVDHLALMKKGDCATVTRVASVERPDQLAIKTRLLELGFAPGEKVRVVAESFPGGDPMAVRLGNTTFALRRHEAAMIQVERPVPPAA